MNPELLTPICQELAWKHAEMRTFAVALVRLALAQAAAEFTTDIVPDTDRLGSPGVAGSVVEVLKNAHVIEPVGVWHGGAWYPKRVISRRPGCKSRYVCVYRLTSAGAARTFLERHGAVTAYREQELALWRP